MSTPDHAVHPTLEALGDHLKGLATIKLEQTNARLAFDAEQAEANRIAETRRFEIEAEERIRLTTLADHLKREETARLAQQKKEPLRDLKAKHQRLFEVCPQLTEEIEALLSSTDLGRDWPHVVKEQLKTSKEMSVELDVYEKWIQTDKAGIDSGFFDVAKWGNLLRSISFSDPGHLSKEFAKIQESAVSAFKENAKQERNKKLAEEEALRAAQQALDDAQAKLDAKESAKAKLIARLNEYHTKFEGIERLGFRNFIWRLCCALNLAIMIVLALVIFVVGVRDDALALTWACTFPVAIALFFTRGFAIQTGDEREVPVWEIGFWIVTAITALLFGKYAGWVLVPCALLMSAVCIGFFWALTTQTKYKLLQALEKEYSDVV